MPGFDLGRRRIRMPEFDTPLALIADLRALIVRIDTNLRMIDAAMEQASSLTRPVRKAWSSWTP